MMENNIFSARPGCSPIETKGEPLNNDSVSRINPKIIKSNMTFSIFSIDGNIVKNSESDTSLSFFSWYLNNRKWWSEFDLSFMDGYQWKT